MFESLFSSEIFYLQGLCRWVNWPKMHYLCRDMYTSNYFAICDTYEVHVIKKCLFDVK